MDDEDPSEGFDLMRSLDKAAEHLSPSVHLARRTGIDSHRVQLMKASLFEEESKFLCEKSISTFHKSYYSN